METLITDGGRSTSSHPLERRDCTVRALAIAAQISYDDAHAIMKLHGRKDRKGMYGYNGKTSRILHSRPCKRSGSLGKFVATHPIGRYIISLHQHATALVDGVIHDTAEQSPFSHVEAAWRLDNGKEIV